MRIIFFAKLSITKVPVRVPCTAGSAWSSGACSTVKPGTKPASASGAGRMNMFRTKLACQAFGVMNRTFRRCFWSAPAQRSWTKTSCASRWARTSARSFSNPAAVPLPFLSHQISDALDGSSTTNLSLGERPVCGEVTAVKAPALDRCPSPRRTACSISCAAVRLAYTRTGCRPASGRVTASGAVRVELIGSSGPFRPVSGQRQAALLATRTLLGVDRSDDRHVHDVVHIRTALQDVDGCSEPHQDGPDRLRPPEPGQQLVTDIGRIEVGENKHIGRAL